MDIYMVQQFCSNLLSFIFTHLVCEGVVLCNFVTCLGPCLSHHSQDTGHFHHHKDPHVALLLPDPFPSHTPPPVPGNNSNVLYFYKFVIANKWNYPVCNPLSFSFFHST